MAGVAIGEDCLYERPVDGRSAHVGGELSSTCAGAVRCCLQEKVSQSAGVNRKSWVPNLRPEGGADHCTVIIAPGEVVTLSYSTFRNFWESTTTTKLSAEKEIINMLMRMGVYLESRLMR